MASRRPPSGWQNRAFALPLKLNELGLGRLLGNRFITIAHQGRRSGRTYESVVEVVGYDPDIPEWTMIAAWREHSDWVANLQHRSALSVTVAGRTYDHPGPRRLDVDEALDVLAAYSAAHPLALRAIFRFVGFVDPRRPGGLREVAETTPMFAFSAKAPAR